MKRAADADRVTRALEAMAGPGRKQQPARPTLRRCPLCGARMLAQKWGGAVRAVCPTHGSYLDSGELRAALFAEHETVPEGGMASAVHRAKRGRNATSGFYFASVTWR